MKYEESKETPMMEAKSHPKGFLKKAASMKKAMPKSMPKKMKK
jgi:hypothetical protein